MIELPELYEIEEQWPTLASLAIIEVLLSVDNLIGISALASHLPPGKRFFALKLGALGTYALRIVSLLLLAPIISRYAVAKIIGALYLIYVATSHFTGKREKNTAGSEDHWSFARTVTAIFLLDLTLSIDNIVAAVSLSKLVWVVCSSVVFGIVFVRVLGPLTMRLVRRIPVLADSVFVLIGWIGLLLLLQTSSHVLDFEHFTDLQRFLVLVLLILLTLIYDASSALQAVVDPLLKAVCLPVMRLVNFPLAILFWPIKKLTDLAHGR